MGQPRIEVDDAARMFIAKQHLFFTATAPANGHINLSPKGLDSFRVLSPRQVAYADYTGSGVETIAHLRENGRITIMFCSFEGSPNILRLYGKGRVVEPADPDFATLSTQVPSGPGLRAFILVDVSRVTDSCGFGVPLYEYKGERDQLLGWAEKKGQDGVLEYQSKKNGRSLDGLAGLRSITP